MDGERIVKLVEGGKTSGRVVDPKAPLAVARQLLAEQFGSTLRHWRGDFLRWAEGAYLREEDAAIRRAIYEYLEAARRDDGSPIAPTARLVSDVVDALRAAAHLAGDTEPPAWLEPFPDAPNPRDLIPLANGIFDPDGGDLMEHSPEFFTLGALPVVHDPKSPPPASWLRFLADLWPDDAEARATLQEWFGYALTAHTRQQKILLVVGPKRAGKGSIARILTGLLGHGNVSAPTLASLTSNFGLAPLIGRRLAIISDARLGSRADQAAIAERLLSISGEDALTIDRKHREAWTGRLDARFMILTNELPKLGDASGALASRFIVLTLGRSFYGREDHSLTDRLLGELPGILNWSLEGLARLRDRGHFEQPESSAEAIRDLEDLGSPISAFVRERCHVEPGAEAETKRLYGLWRDWCGEHGRAHPGTEQTFGRDLKAAVPGITTGYRRNGAERSRVYVGVSA